MADVPAFDPSKPFEEVTSAAPAFDPSKPFEEVKTAAPKADYSWGQAITDIPTEIGKEARSAFGAMGDLADRYKQGPVEGLMTTGRAALAVPQLIASPITGAARSVLGHGMANLEHLAGTYLNPAVAAQQDPAQVYETAKSDVDKAMSAAAARRPLAAPTMTPIPPRPETIGSFGVPLTEGEAARNFEQIALERRALRGGEGPRAQQVAQEFQNQRNQALAEARGSVAQSMDPYRQQIVATPQEAGELAGAGVQSAAQGLRDIRNARYEEFANLPGEIHAGAFEGIAQKIKGELSLGDSPVIIDDVTTPVASRALSDIEDNINRLRIQNRADPFGQPNPENIVGINLQGIDQQRKRLVTFYKDAKTWPPTADMRATQSVLRAFDDHVQNAIEQGLFSGDERALDALREARAAHSEYMRTFTSQGTGDDVGRVMQHILGSPYREAATPTEIANYLYGSAKVGAKGLSYRLADRLGNVLGRNSPEWIGIKQGLWSRLAEATEGTTEWGPEKVANRIGEFLNGDGRATAQRMFSEPERNMMQRYADLLRQTVPPPGAVNYSNNVPMLASLRQTVTRFFMSTLGAHIGGMVGGVAGYAAASAAKPISGIMRARKIARQMPTITESMRRWNQTMVDAQRTGMPSSPAVIAATGNLVSNLRKAGMDEETLRRAQNLMP